MKTHQEHRLISLHSQGSWFSPAIRANTILGRRMMRDRGFRATDVAGLLAGKLDSSLLGSGVPDPRTARRWESDKPQLPEELRDIGLLSEEDILPAFRTYLKPSNRLDMSQREAIPITRDFSYESLWVWGALLIAVLLINAGKVTTPIRARDYYGLKRLRTYP